MIEAPVRFAYALARRRRYFLVTPTALKHQVLFDRKAKRFITLEIRDRVDFGTLSQIYLAEDYGLDKLRRQDELHAFYNSIMKHGKTPLIVDCGGHIGLACRYFSENYPDATIVCIEPNPSNITQARKNNTPRNVAFIQAAVGSETSRGRLIDPGLGSSSYRVNRDEGGSTKIISLNHVLEQHQSTQYTPFIVKIDIEGSEGELFSKNTEWIERFPLLIIELHDWLLPHSASATSFIRAIGSLDRDFVYHGENIFSISNVLL